MKIAVLVSGGVDSSVSLALLKHAGYDVTAFYLKIWLEDELSFLGECPWEEDLLFVKETCAFLDVPLEIISLQQEYWDAVVSYTVKEAKEGRTPNPDVLCNQYVKFDAFFKKISLEYEKVATGHYAQTVTNDDGTVDLLCSPDTVKDQTYFLSHLSQSQLKRALFPIGKYTKEEVRKLADSFNLPTAKRKDSYGICFLGKISFDEFLKHHLDTKTGDLIEFETGKKLGTHNGFWFYTIGQRKGLGLSGGPWYVVTKDPTKNIVYISCKYHAPEMERKEFLVERLHWINKPPTTNALSVKLRHGPEQNPCSITINGNNAIVCLQNNDQGIAPGQFAVFYDKETCLGCGVISLPTAPTFSS
ncbi:tRNA 2-thiouridine(34) synthase MnmA [Candidatus Dependentiae bacterium]|nr:tRNA 2-thiouridine(34) synthase MnmA [Candidatus Dependentiae bacterium]